MARRLPQVRRAAQEFEDLHSRANGVVADTVTNLVAVRSAATEENERARVADLLDRSVAGRFPGPVHLHEDPAPTGVVDPGRYLPGPAGRHHHGPPPLDLGGGHLPDPVLLGPGGHGAAAVVRAHPHGGPGHGADGQVHGDRRRDGGDRGRPRRRRSGGGHPDRRLRPGDVRLRVAPSALRRPRPGRRPRRARGPGRTLGLGEVDAVQAPAAPHGRGRRRGPGRRGPTSGT